MRDQHGSGKTFGMSGDAKERQLADIRRTASAPPAARSSAKVWLVAASFLALALVGGVLVWRWAAAPGDGEDFTVRCQFPGASTVIPTATLLGPEDAIRLCGQSDEKSQGVILADGQLPVTCLDASTRVVVLDGSEVCPPGSTQD